jgi:hypothetical protein
MTATTEPTAVTLSRKTFGTLYEDTDTADLSLWNDHDSVSEYSYCGHFDIDSTPQVTDKITFGPITNDAKLSKFKVRADEYERFTGDSSIAPDDSEWTVKSVTCYGQRAALPDLFLLGDKPILHESRDISNKVRWMDWTFERNTVSEDGELIDTDELPQEARAELGNTVPEDGEPIDTDEQPQEARPELRPAGHCWGSWRISL